MENLAFHHPVDRRRRAGVLLHPSSLPESVGNGDIGHQAYRFIELLNATGFKVWQMLPLGPTHDDKSPYQCLSSHAGNPLLISLEWLEDKGWLERGRISPDESADNYRRACLYQAAASFYKENHAAWATQIGEFARQHSGWLDDYALFVALKERYQYKPWYEWPAPVRHRDPEVLEQARRELEASIRVTVFQQFIFFTQWHEIREYARRHDVELFGDMPIFVARDSADVWAERENFLIDDDGEMQFIAGVPPDAFSSTGQRWGNPLYNWEYMKSAGFGWWKRRFETQLELFDMIRIDHFRGLQACWQIPGKDETAMHGRWVEVPGRELLAELNGSFRHLPLVAEDLGVITDRVIALKKAFNLPGMKVLQFAFDGSNSNPHLPHNHERDDIVYVGTHDNNTTIGWIRDTGNYNRSYLEEYIDTTVMSDEQGAWSLMRLAMSSVSFLCILSMQDVLMLDSSARMNVPGTSSGNWGWRFEWQQVKPGNLERLSHLMALYQR